MRIKVKLYAMLAKYLPPGSEDHTALLDVPEGTTAHDLIVRMELPPALSTLVMVDGIHLTPKDVDHRLLQPGETVAIFPPIAGGR